MSNRTSKLTALNLAAEAGGGADKMRKLRESGRLSARERIQVLLDSGTFVEIDKLKHSGGTPGDGVVTGYGTIDGRQVFVFAQDFTVVGGTIGRAHGEKICKMMDLAKQVGSPVIALLDSAGARIQEGVDALAGYGEVLLRTMQNSGVVPQIACIMGPCVGGAACGAGMNDVVFMVQGEGSLFITGPEVTQATTNEDVTKDSLGGPKIHAETSGVAHLVFPDDQSCLERVRELLTYLPSNNAEDPARYEDVDATRSPDLMKIVPDSPSKAYDVKHVIEAIIDGGSFFELHEAFAKNIVVGLARIGGRTIGVVANQPMHLAGCLDVDASLKAARFVRFCDCFNIPLLSLVDAPGFLPGTQQEHAGIVTHAAKLLYAYAESTVPKVSLVLRKAYGAAYVVMGSKHLKGDVNFALPTAEIAVMAPESAITVVYKSELNAQPQDAVLRKRLSQTYRDDLANPFIAAERGYIDEVIPFTDARQRIGRTFEMLRDKRQSAPPRKHGNIPL